MDINASKYMVAQLRGWIQKLNLPTAGTKNVLVLRLNEIAVEKRGGECPVDVCSIETNITDEECEEIANGIMCVDGQMSGKEKTSANEMISEDEQMSVIRSEQMSANIVVSEHERDVVEQNNLMKRELELLKREKELLEKENYFYKIKFEKEHNEIKEKN